MNSIYRHRNNIAVEEDPNLSRRIRNMEFTALSQYGKETLKPVEPKDTVAIFTLSKYINDLEKNLVDLSIGLETKVGEVIANLSENPVAIASVAPVVKKDIYQPTKTLRGAFGSGTTLAGSGITEQNIITRVVSSWNAFTAYLQNFKNLNQLTRSETDELYTLLGQISPTVDKIINDIMIIETNNPSQSFEFEKKVLLAIAEKIDSRNLSKINLNEIAPDYTNVENNIETLKQKANEYLVENSQYEVDRQAVEDAEVLAKNDLATVENSIKAWRLADKTQRENDYKQEIDRIKADNLQKELENANRIQLASAVGATPQLLVLEKVPPPKTFKLIDKKNSPDYPQLLYVQRVLEDLENEKEALLKIDPMEKYQTVRKRLAGGEDFQKKMVSKEERLKRNIIPKKLLHFHSDLNDFYRDDVYN